MQDTFFNPSTPISLLKRAMDGKTEDLMNVLNGWEPWMTPMGMHQALQQGGMFLFHGYQDVFSHYDQVGQRVRDQHTLFCLCVQRVNLTRNLV